MGDGVSRLVPPKTRFTKTPNRLLDELARSGAALPARHRSVVEFLVREILGWHYNAVAVSQRAVGARLGVSPRTVRAVVADLERWRVLRRRGGGQGRVAIFELLEPAGWRITKTAAAIRRAEARRRARGCDQPLLPFGDVAVVVDHPTRLGVTSRDTRGGIPRGLAAALLLKRKKYKGVGIAEPGGTVRVRSRAGDRMPNDEPPKATPEELAQIRRTRAARARVRRLDRSRVFDQAFVEWVAGSLNEAEVEEEIRLREAELAADHETQQRRRQVDAMRHEGRR